MKAEQQSRNMLEYVHMSIRPVILAAGKEMRFNGGDDGKTIKPLMEINGPEVGGPVICQALYYLSRMAIRESEVTIVVNESNRGAIGRAVGSGAVNFVTQSLSAELTGPAAGLKAAYDADPLLDESLAIQADDAHWTGPIMRPFVEHWDRHSEGVVASMALLPKGDPGIHRSTYYTNLADDVIIGYRDGLPDYRFRGQGCNAGLYIERRDSFMAAYPGVSNTNSDPGIPSIINHHLDNNLPVTGPAYDVPWKSANTPQGLEAARALAVTDKPSVELPTLTDIIAYTTRSS